MSTDTADALREQVRERNPLFVSAALPWPSATSTPSPVTTNMFVVVNFSGPAWKSS